MWEYIIDHSDTIVIVILVIALILIAISFAWGRNILVSSSKPPSKGDLIGVYYLPHSLLNIEVRTKVIMEVTSGKITSTKVVSQQYKISEEVSADYSNPVYLSYRSNPFSDEEVHFELDEKGLLDTIHGSSDNRMDDILFSLIDFNAESSENLQGAYSVMGWRKKVQVKIVEQEFVNHFEIETSKLLTGVIEKKWKATVFFEEDIDESEQVDIGFRISKINASNGAPNETKLTEENGLVFPLRTALTINIASLSANLSDYQFLISYYDPSNYYAIPIKTTPFAHRVQKLKIQDGLMESHQLKNPSSMVGIANVPIRMGRAIFSIPAQLFSLHIGTYKKRAELEKLEMAHAKDLVNAKKDLLKAEGDLLKTRTYLRELKNDSNLEIDRLNRIISELKK